MMLVVGYMSCSVIVVNKDSWYVNVDCLKL